MKHRRIYGGILVLLILLSIAAAWHWTPLNNWLDLETIVDRGGFLRENPLAVLVVLGVYMVAGVVVFPVTLLVIATAIIFNPAIAFVYSLLGCLMSAALLFGMGHIVGHETVHRLVGTRLNRISTRLSHRGLLTVVTLRLFPLAPYSVVNFVVGASHIRFHDFVIGTVIGLIPGLFAITIFGESLADTIRNPKWENFLFLVALILLFVLANVATRRWLEKKDPDPAPR